MKITTQCLNTRSMREADASFCFSIWLDGEMGRYLIDPPKEQATEKYLNFAIGIENTAQWFPLIIELKETNELVGTCSYVPQSDGTWDIGYTLHKDYWRRGYATEALNGLIELARSQGVIGITSCVAQKNVSSITLLNNLGFVLMKKGSFIKSGTDWVFDDFTHQLKL